MGSFCGRVLRLRLNGERSGAVSTPTCETSTRSNRIHNALLALSVCILAFAAFLVSPALALADNGNGRQRERERCRNKHHERSGRHDHDQW